jgi:histidinol-phosphate phosphatase family protein
MSRTLFLDRDGVINRRIVGGYVLDKAEFEVLPGVFEAMSLFAKKYDHIFMVTNQQGIGKGLMTEAQLKDIHDDFVRQVEASCGRVDHIYYCPALKEAHSFMRKPAIGMALQARRDYPDVNFRHSVMVGDSRNDMLFGCRAGMTTVLVGDEPEVAKHEPHLVNYYYPDLLAFAKSDFSLL